MKAVLACALLALSFLSASCNSSARTEPIREPFFLTAGFDSNSQVRSVSRLLSYAQSKLGIKASDYEYWIPEGRKLEVTLLAEMDGKVVRKMSGTWHIPPGKGNDNRVGSISVFHFDPPANAQASQEAVWEMRIIAPSGSGEIWSANSPFRVPRGSKFGVSEMIGGANPLEEDREVQIWEYHLPFKPEGASKAKPFDFKYTLKVKLTKLQEGERLERIKRVELPSSN